MKRVFSLSAAVLLPLVWYAGPQPEQAGEERVHIGYTARAVVRSIPFCDQGAASFARHQAEVVRTVNGILAP
jgi:hypothetical protein